MGTPTPHLSLNKPDGGELVNVVTAINQNMDKVDASALNHSSRITAVEAVAGIENDDPWLAHVPAVLAIGPASIIATPHTFKFFKIGRLIHCTLEIPSIPAAAYADINVKVELPYKSAVTKHAGGGVVRYATGSVFLALNHALSRDVYVGGVPFDENHVTFFGEMDGVWTISSVVPFSGHTFPDATSYFSASWSYLSTGVPT